MSRAIAILLATLVLLMPPVAARQRDTTVFVRIPAGALQQVQEAGLQPVHVLDYGSFAWLELAEADLDVLQAAGLPHELQADPYLLRLGDQSFDPLRDGVRLPAGWPAGLAAEKTGSDLRLVQLVGPVRDEWLDALDAGGLDLVSYIHPYTYIAWGDVAALARAAEHDFVRWTGDFEPAFRLDARWREMGQEWVRANVLLYRGADAARVRRGVEALGGKLDEPVAMDDVLAVSRLHLRAPALPAAARIPGVYSIQLATTGGLRGEMSNQVSVNNLNAAGYAFPGYRDWLAAVGVDGTGIIIANVDAGIRDTHLDLIGRMAPCMGDTCGGIVTSNHGTHTAGIMAADGSTAIADGDGFLRGLGMAPGARLVEQLFSPTYLTPEGMRYLMTESYRNGASISGNSWGSANTPQGYDLYTRAVDTGVRDADPAAPGNQPLAYVLSIMNGWGGTSTQGAPDEAKNTLTVGSTYLQNIYGQVPNDGTTYAAIDDLSPNTAHGPALDGRKIPHLVAPGYSVDSTGSGSDTDHLLMYGTSMASPHVSGAAALFVQYYRQRRGVDPSPAMIKAAFLPVAHDLYGHWDADRYEGGEPLGHPFDSKQGWGRLDAEAVLDPQVPVLCWDQGHIFDSTGQVWQRELQVADATRPVRLMLVWTDAPGHGLGLAARTQPAWNNDLDLVVEAGGLTYVGNFFGPDGWSQADGIADYQNNTEGVFLPAGGASSFTVEVVAQNINSDGIPDQGDGTDQDFALVCYNCLPVFAARVFLPIIQK